MRRRECVKQKGEEEERSEEKVQTSMDDKKQVDGGMTGKEREAREDKADRDK